MTTKTPKFTKTHQKRLLNVVRALRESENVKAFTMTRFGFGKDTISDAGTVLVKGSEVPVTCGTPACALGHYAARPDLQKKFKLTKSAGYVKTTTGHEVNIGTGGAFSYPDTSRSVLNHFGISNEESIELFGTSGCNDAQTPESAAKYIEKFVAKKAAQRA